MRCNYLSIAIVLCSLLAGSCDLFDTRDAAPPDSKGNLLPIAFTHEILFDNFQQSFKDVNVDEYAKLFSDTVTHAQAYVYIPIPSLASRFTSWNNISEREYFRKAKEAASNASSFTFLPPSNIQINTHQSDSAHYFFNYELIVPHQRTDLTTKFEGGCELFAAKGKDQIWRIYRWIDYETKQDSSWSELKAYFAK